VFLGGAIFPGPRLMALALHQHTAMLPLVEMIGPRPAAPAPGTRAAIELGIHWAMVGGINGLIQEMGSRLTHDPRIMDIFVTGGGSQAVANQLIGNTTQCPRLVLEGICLAAAALP
jgi:type III pantothenate kinase